MLRLFPSRILRSPAQSGATRAASDWSKTLNLPKSTFPARPTAAQLETYRQRCADELYTWQRQEKSSCRASTGEIAEDEFVLHDGPPYANGAVHAGHALNKILKDIIVRSELGKGKRVHYQPGWDCHGLPIELKALQQRTSTTKDKGTSGTTGVGIPSAEIRQTAGQLAARTIEEQKQEFCGWNVMGEWDQPYKTMDKDFEIRQLGVFKEMVKKGLIFRDHRPVYWSPSSRTALAEAELEYDDKHACTAAFVKMPFTKLPGDLKRNDAIIPGKLCALIWTTTPWTLPANKAIAFNPDIEYTVVEFQGPAGSNMQAEQLLLGKQRVEHVLAHLPEGTVVKTVVDSILGSQLSSGDPACFNIFQAGESRVVAADFVLATSGTGLVHMAPGHGMEDYQVCQTYNIGPAFAPVDGEGQFTRDSFPAEQESMLTGLFAEKGGVMAVLEILRNPTPYLPPDIQAQDSNLLLASHKFVHKNPIDWRTKEPVIVRATAQWFADVSLIKNRALKAIDSVRFIPESGRTRLKAFIEGRSQWCISRQRVWGVPIPALYHKISGEACISEASITHIINVIQDRGTDAWFSDAADEPAWIHPSLEPGLWTRGTDTMDVWFDSGTTWTSLPARDGKRPLADIYVEGSDQHRGWFQSSLLTAVATQDPTSVPLAPYSTLLTHGFILDGEGRKMSKSLGNVISPAEIVSGSLLQQPTTKAGKKGKVPVAQLIQKSKKKQDAFGPDLLRLWVASSDYTKDVPISQKGLLGVQQALQKYRVTMKFLCGVLADHRPTSFAELQAPELSFADQAILHRLAQRSAAIYSSYKAYRFHEGVREINSFVNTDLSAFYFEIAKDPLYAGLSQDRIRVQSVLAMILDRVFHWLAPLTPALVEETWEHLPPGLKDGQVHPLKRVWEVSEPPQDTQFQHSLSAFDSISSAVKYAQETARAQNKLGSGLACRVRLCLLDHQSNERPVARLLAQHPRLGDELASLLVVSEAEVVWLPKEHMLERPHANSAEELDTDADWMFEAAVELGGLAGGPSIYWAKVQVLPPRKEKCVRCWNYVADEKEGVCGRCVEAVKEKEEA